MTLGSFGRASQPPEPAAGPRTPARPMQEPVPVQAGAPASGQSSSSAPIAPLKLESSSPAPSRLSGGALPAPSCADSERRYRPQKYCAVCGDKAIACNFNAVTCESCKAFFRRNAFKEPRLKCLFENRCIIDRVTRRFCSKCRLLKCFQIGMKREWILTDEQKQIKRVKILQNKQSKLRLESSPARLEPQSRASPAADQPCSPKHSSQRNGAAGAAGSPGGSLSRVEMRDATTSCPDESELEAPNFAAIHYCSLVSQCHYCSLRLAANQHQSVADYQLGHQTLHQPVLQQQQQQHQIQNHLLHHQHHQHHLNQQQQHHQHHHHHHQQQQQQLNQQLSQHLNQGQLQQQQQQQQQQMVLPNSHRLTNHGEQISEQQLDYSNSLMDQRLTVTLTPNQLNSANCYFQDQTGSEQQIMAAELIGSRHSSGSAQLAGYLTDGSLAHTINTTGVGSDVESGEQHR